MRILCPKIQHDGRGRSAPIGPPSATMMHALKGVAQPLQRSRRNPKVGAMVTLQRTARRPVLLMHEWKTRRILTTNSETPESSDGGRTGPSHPTRFYHYMRLPYLGNSTVPVRDTYYT